MEIIKVVPSNSNLWDQVWRVYVESFPEHERRRISGHTRACENESFHTYIAVDNGNLQAIIFYWTYGNTIYIEHFAVNPLMRGKNIGTKLLSDFIVQNKGMNIILEIEPPVDEITKRRLNFYDRIGFLYNEYHYVHPSYTKKGTPHELKIMSYPNKVTPEELDKFKEFMSSTVMQYID